ncbi:RHH-type proline utilization regulon transcriptional repressor/proline dehydrogenase/delta 1-pyrroline-5-carboxylate dehydrogenase [Dysgonomonas sp. PFB1-18]|uniref:bifunctional proline dehydrogenase/L-glutamate gamma-semialdehyde dehydrogenase n=1 Tax=unclassified Dysgonomonas TaxID=2630389 RepID=UPI00247539BE|nr:MULTISPECIES: bifunctional proline dehydrogenase/L-glutamate gamma-semialdehyde dehydrogenase [unclassified Dysgonomonas]MDH6308566.1 RHH-type proline utilization regulon transcriptional repressor/proline dehydrogenase/delta 1-pyrroline-5-carboxylate dehydrogenase [Dysgonomonas sp. PF1-14]MDH6338067.1 RHH-type proline utilization regulon transcriptional repressor/proline dehydrogenase/delta 1-pyrroline-5-carboxylate dehydrogenase [Dysgonomonas sp. PF1-16]MDH6379564.1 RHH-type proline utilizat
MEKITSTEVLEWAKDFLNKAEKELTPDEIKEQKKYASLIQTPANKTLLSKMLDESSQVRDNSKVIKRMTLLIKEYGIPDFFNSFDKFQLRLFMNFGFLAPNIAMPLFNRRLRKETNKIIIAEERPKLTDHLSGRWNSKIGQNVNLLGEVVLGDGEANKRYLHYLEALKEPDINYISIKLSGIYAQIHPLSYEQNKAELCELVASIYRQAIKYPYTDQDGITKPKFVNLDMEEYKDMDITLDVFETVLSMPEFKDYTAGIVVQAYLPDAGLLQDSLLTFAKKRYAEGGAPLKMRLVKGANLQMESIISSLRGWPNPIFASKVEVDANYMRILDIALQPENAEALQVGVASHNFFSIAYAYLLSQKNGVSDYVTFEMLEGMANHLPRVVRNLDKQIILYTPVVKKEHFLNAISYLVRRLDENTGKDNFLSYSFNLQLNSPQWNFLVNQFEEAYKLKDTIVAKPLRTQNRNEKPIPVKDINVFHNEPDTDLDLDQNRQWALGKLKKWGTEVNGENFIVPVQIGDREVITEHKKKYYDRSRNDDVCFCEANLSTLDQIKEIITIAEEDKPGWRQTDVNRRNEILHQVADNISAKRGDLIGCMAAITGKTFMEGDVEVSEAIDFCRFYPITMKHFAKLNTVSYTPKGIILVIPPWNFPLAIPVGGIASALAGGNTVILKPATVALPIAWEFAKCFWDAGVPKETLQVVCSADRSSLNYLTAHPSIKHVILTGGTDTAFRLLENSPRTPLSAETGGKNAIILTGNGDQDHAILNVVASAFGNAGQKCSACSLLLVDKKTYNDESFRSKLKDAVESMRTGSVWDTMNMVGPMITNDNEKLLHAIEHLEEGESWLVAPEFLDEKKYILKPTVKWGVKPSSFTFKNELFAPLLSVVCIDDLKQGIEYANSSEYGLTAGLQSLDENEQQLWKNSIEAGNLYINRGITGAIVNRQPFGGMKRSAFGGGIKAGGPNYVSCFVKFEEKAVPSVTNKAPLSELISDEKERNRFNYAYESYMKEWGAEFSQERDVNHIYGEENTFRYLPLKSVGFRVMEKDSLSDVLLVITASDIARTPITISISDKDAKLETLKQAVPALLNVQMKIQAEEQFIAEMEQYERIRACSTELPDAAYLKAAKLGKHIASDKPLAEGRLELLHYLKEQSIAFEYHRYGSIFGEDK